VSLNRRVESDLVPHASSSLLYLRRESHADRLAFPPARGTFMYEIIIRSIWVPESDLRFHALISPLPGLPPVRDLLLCAKHLFVAAMVAGVHQGKSEHDRGAVRVRSREVCRGSKSKAPPPSPAGALCPLSRDFLAQRGVLPAHQFSDAPT
jgi:hypothetical protein